MARRSVFISYSTVDRDDVHGAVDLLRASGAKVFLDVASIDFGERWKDALYKALDRCERVMVFWSHAAAASEWVEREWRYALELGKKIVPTLLDFTPLPPELAEFQAVKRIRPGLMTTPGASFDAGRQDDRLQTTQAHASQGWRDRQRLPSSAADAVRPRRALTATVAAVVLLGAIGAGGYFWLSGAPQRVDAPAASVPARPAAKPAPGVTQPSPTPTAPGALPPVAAAPAPPVRANMAKQLLSSPGLTVAGLLLLVALAAWLIGRRRGRLSPDAAAFVEQVFAA